MGVFDDKKFEELDWISQATEPIDSIINQVLAELPDEVVIDFNMYRAMVIDSYGMDLSVDTAINYLIKQNAAIYNLSLTYHQREAVVDCFEFDVEESLSDLNIDFENKEITGNIKLIKTVTTMDEKVLEGMLGKEGIQEVASMWFSGQGLSRANEIMELLGGCNSGLKTRSERKKKYALKERLIQLFKNNEWKIKDTELANKVGYWIVSYVKDGNLAAYSNFCRLKVMTHKQQPIYSMEEIK